MFERMFVSFTVTCVLALSTPSSCEVHLGEIVSLSAFCTELNKETFCTEQCTNMARMAIQRICQDRRLSKTYTALTQCEHAKAGICRWFRCRCMDPSSSEPTLQISLRYCKKTLLKYFELNEELGTNGFEEY
ncbi:uncharacterized protein [Bemisia tabaci]|uniref:uncharacterized protein n=1 Tax=Bemisia tabaci TaxID=7038 RepID=UPI003B2807B5